MSANASFRDLVRAARGGTRARGSCILSGGRKGEPAFLRSPVVANPKDLEEPPADLDERMTRRAPGSGVGVNVHAPWGSAATAYDLDLVALTPVSRALMDTVTTLIVATNQGFYVLHAGVIREAGNSAKMTSEELREALGREINTKLWLVSAEGATPLPVVRAALAAIPPGRGSVVLTTPLDVARRPDGSVQSPELDPADPDGCTSSAPPARSMSGGASVGAASSTSLDDGIRAALQSCVDARPDDGGRVNLQLRFDSHSTVEGACALSDHTHSPPLRRCMLERIRGLASGAAAVPPGLTMELVVQLPGRPVAGLCDP